MPSSFKHLSQPSAEVIEIKNGGGFLILFGLPFLLVGLMIMLAPLGIVPLESSPEMSFWEKLFFPAFGLVFFLAGAGLIFGRSGLIIDRAQGVLIQWRGLLVPMQKKEHLLENFNKVIVSSVQGKNSSESYPVELKSNDGSLTISISQFTDYIQSRRFAEQLSKFLKLPLEDSVSGKKTIREYEHLDESLVERMKRTREKIVIPPQPITMRSQLLEQGTDLIIEIPGPRFNFVRLGLSLIPLLFFAFFGYQILAPFLKMRLTLELKLGILVLGLLIFLFGFYQILKRARKEKTRIIVSPVELIVERFSSSGMKRETIPLSELEDLVLTDFRRVMGSAMEQVQGSPMSTFAGESGMMRMPDGSPAPRWMLALSKLAPLGKITAQSDKVLLHFGQGLAEEELAFIYAMILKTIASRGG